MEGGIMQKRLVMGASLSVMLIGLTGCPPTQVSPGLWLFTLTSNGGEIGNIGFLALILLDGGQTQ